MRASLPWFVVASPFVLACSADRDPSQRAEPAMRVQAPLTVAAILEDPGDNGDQFGESVALTDTEVFGLVATVALVGARRRGEAS